jgi:hypothetical protein
MEKQNCWEFKKCGREQGGKNINKLGVCPAAKPGEGKGFNNGKCRGRVCWSVAGTFCEGLAEGSFARTFHTCMVCAFFNKVKEEEGEKFDLLIPVR